MSPSEWVPETCVVGKCPYGDLCNITPGLITAYQQSRGEVASIPFSENRGFKFHNDVVQQACIPQWLRAVGDHMLDIPSLEFVVRRDMLESGSFIQVVTHTIQLVLPEVRFPQFISTRCLQIPITHFTNHILQKHTFYGNFKIFAIAEAEDSTPHGAICVCDLQALVSDMNRKKEALIHTDDMFDPYIPLPVVPVGEYVVAFAEAEAFKDFVFRLRSNVTNETDLDRCASCGEVVDGGEGGTLGK